MRPGRWPAAWAAIGIALLLLSPVFPREGSNAESRWVLTRAIVERGTFAIDGLEGATHDRAFRDGHWYSDKAPGLSWLGVPVLWAVRAGERLVGGVPEEGERLLVRLATVTIPSFVVMVFAFILLRRRGCDPFRAGLWPTIWWCATPAFLYGGLLFSHQAAAWMLAAAFLSLALGRGRRWAAPAAGLLAGLAVTVEYVAAIAVVAGLALLPFERRRDRVAAAVATLPPLLLMASYNTACFGAPWRLGYQFQTWPASSATEQGIFGFAALTWKGLATIFLSPAHGLFFFVPFLVVPLAAALARPRLPGRDSAGMLLFIAYAVLFSAYAEPEAGACVGPRHLVPYLPLAVWWAAGRTRAGTAGETLTLGLALGAAIRTGMLAAGDILVPYSAPDPITGHLLPLLRAGVVSGDPLGMRVPFGAAVAVAGIGLLLPLALALGRRIVAPVAVACLFLGISAAAELAVAPADPVPAAFDRAFALRSLGHPREAMDQIAPHLDGRRLTPAQGTLALEVLGEVDPARARAFGAGLAEDPGEKGRRLSILGRLAWREGDAAAARDAWREAIGAGERSPEVYMNLALAEERQGRSDRALAAALEGIVVNPSSAMLRLRAGRLSLEAGHGAEGKALLRRALELDPGLPGGDHARALLREAPAAR